MIKKLICVKNLITLLLIVIQISLSISKQKLHKTEQSYKKETKRKSNKSSPSIALYHNPLYSIGLTIT